MSHVPGWFPWLHSILSESWGVSFSHPYTAFLMALMSGDPLYHSRNRLCSQFGWREVALYQREGFRSQVRLFQFTLQRQFTVSKYWFLFPVKDILGPITLYDINGEGFQTQAERDGVLQKVHELGNHRDISDFKSLVCLLISYINKFSSSPHSSLLPVKWGYQS